MTGRNLTMAGVIWLMVFVMLFALAIVKGIGLLLLFSCWLGAALIWNTLRCPLGLSRAQATINDDDTLEAGLPGRVRVLVWLEGDGEPVSVRLSVASHSCQNVVLGTANQEIWVPLHPQHRGWTQLPEAWFWPKTAFWYFPGKARLSFQNSWGGCIGGAIPARPRWRAAMCYRQWARSFMGCGLGAPETARGWFTGGQRRAPA